VLLQTHYPEHPQLQLLLERGYADYAQSLLQERQHTGMPPFGYLLLLRAEAGQASQAESFLRSIRDHTAAGVPPGGRLIGPLPAPMQRRGGRHRMHLHAVCPTRGGAQQVAELLVTAAQSNPDARRVRWNLDVDPQDMM
jgi:primosomal protein N' (replication factor Y)